MLNGETSSSTNENLHNIYIPIFSQQLNTMLTLMSALMVSVGKVTIHNHNRIRPIAY